MVARVLIRGGQLSCIRVSLPGVDVNGANLTQLAFDAQFANLTLYMRGFVNITQNSPQTVFFGETLAQPPLCFCSINSNTPFYTHNNGNGQETYASAIVSTSGVRFEFWAGGNTPVPVYFALIRQLKG